jgi:hypothetical protein
VSDTNLSQREKRKVMHSRRFLQFAPAIVGILLLTEGVVHAKFLLKFTDGRKMTVTNYREEGKSVTVYTLNGSFSFQKKDIVQIVNLDPTQKSAETSSHLAGSATVPPIIEPAPIAKPQERKVAPSSLVVAAQESLPSFSSEVEDVFDFVKTGLYRARFFVALFVGLKVMQFFLPASLR